VTEADVQTALGATVAGALADACVL